LIAGSMDVLYPVLSQCQHCVGASLRGKEVLLPAGVIDRIAYDDPSTSIRTLEQIKNSPELARHRRAARHHQRQCAETRRRRAFVAIEPVG
jgi:hypothetical protein